MPSAKLGRVRRSWLEVRRTIWIRKVRLAAANPMDLSARRRNRRTRINRCPIHQVYDRLKTNRFQIIWISEIWNRVVSQFRWNCRNAGTAQSGARVGWPNRDFGKQVEKFGCRAKVNRIYTDLRILQGAWLWKYISNGIALAGLSSSWKMAIPIAQSSKSKKLCWGRIKATDISWRTSTFKTR